MSKEITEYKIAKEIFKLSRDLIMSDEAQQMKNYTQHGTTSVFEHTLSVAKFSLIFAINLENVLGVKVDREALVRGALLHDYFLYDWHKPSEKRRGLHGFTHPAIACDQGFQHLSHRAGYHQTSYVSADFNLAAFLGRLDRMLCR